MLSSSLQFQSSLSMDGEIITPGQSSKSKRNFGVIHILVVDDDSTSLAIVAGILKTWKYEVLTVKHPVDALCTLRMNQGLIDLVITDVHMPDINGFELQKQIDEEFKLPVVMISADDKESVMLRGLEGGAVFFILKPINPNDLKSIWQYAVATKKGKSITIEEETGIVQGITLAKRIPYEDRESSSSVNEDRGRKNDYNRKSLRKVEDRKEGKNDSKTPKKAKVVWSTRLHNRFLNAIGTIGLEKAVPKRILNFMNVPGLTRENIASHLQKYRIFLKKVTDASDNDSKNSSDRALRSSFGMGHFSLMVNNRQQEYPRSLEQQQMRTTFQPRFGVNIPVGNAPSRGSVRFPNDHESSSSNSITQFGYGQSNLLSSQATVQQPMSSNTNHLYQPNRLSLGMEPNNIRTGWSSRGDISSGIMNGTSGLMNGTNGLLTSANTMPRYQQQGLLTGTNTMPMYQQAAQARPELFTSDPSNYNFRTYGVGGHNGIPGIENVGSFNSFQPIPSYNDTNNYYAGLIQMNSGGELVRSSQMGFAIGDRMENGVNGSYGSMNEQMESGNFGYFTRGMSSSLGFESANQLTPTFSTNVIQQENGLVQPLPPPPPQQNSFGNDGEQTNYMFGPINNTSTFNNISPLQPFGGGDLSDILLNPINDQSPSQQQGGEEVLNPDFTIGSYHVEESPQLIVQTLDQQEGGEEVMAHVFGDNLYQSDDYFPFSDQYPNQQHVGEELVNSELYGTYQGDNEDVMESLFGAGAYLRE